MSGPFSSIAGWPEVRTGYEDPYDYPDLPLWQRLWLAAHSDLDPDALYGVGEGDGAYDTINGLLAQQDWRYDVTVANTMGLPGDWGVDDVTDAVANALHEYRDLRAQRDALAAAVEVLANHPDSVVGRAPVVELLRRVLAVTNPIEDHPAPVTT